MFSPVISEDSSSSTSSQTFTLNSHTDDVSSTPSPTAAAVNNDNNADNSDNNAADTGDVLESSSCTLDEVDVSRLLVVKSSPVPTSVCLSVCLLLLLIKKNLHEN